MCLMAKTNETPTVSALATVQGTKITIGDLEYDAQHQEEDRRDKSRDDRTDGQATRIYAQIIVTNVSASKPNSRSTI